MIKRIFIFIFLINGINIGFGRNFEEESQIYDNIKSIEDEQIKGESFLEVYNDENGIDENLDFFENLETEDVGVSTRNIPPVNPPLPINDYLPLLAVAAVGLGFYYRKELKLKSK